MTRSTSVAAQLAALPTMPMKDLWALWDAHFPRRPGTWNRDYVASRVAYKIQEAAHGGVDPDVRRRLVRLGESQSAFGKRRSEVHLMPGTVLLREYESNEYRVTVTPEGFYDLNGKVPCQVDGGLKCFGHPIGASGLRMIYEMYLQFHGRAGQRQLENPRYGLTHNLGGFPFMNVCSIAIVGKNEA